MPGERVPELADRRQQAVHGHRGGRDVHRGRKRVVGRLRHVDVVVRMNRLFAAETSAADFDGAVGDDLVGVHVGLRAAAGLPDFQGEMLVPSPGDDFVGRLCD